MLNYVRYYIKQSPREQQPTLIAFNPWWFSGSEDLVRAFFGQLQAHLSRVGRAATSLRNKLADFSETVAEIPLPYAELGKMGAKVLEDEAQGRD